MNSVNIGLVGLGTVGKGVYQLINKNRSLIRDKSGVDIRIHMAADTNSEMQKSLDIPSEIFTDCADKVLESPGVDIVVELIGGTTTARQLILKALKNKKHVVTANKALLADHGKQIFSEAVKNRMDMGFEAAVGGGIPIIKTIREALVGNEIQKIIGIVNGTTNFILTEMTRQGLTFKQALTRAQELGFAEKDPTLDISGGDARHKITILSSLAFNTMVDIHRVYTEGIEYIDRRDIQYAGELGFVVKLLATAQRVGEGVLVKVHPSFINQYNPLAAVSWEDNAIMVYSDFLGKSMYYGKGAGSRPTASAVVSDITEIALRLVNGQHYNPSLYSFFNNLDQLDSGKTRARYYFRFNALDRPGILSRISGVLGNHNISIASVIQKESEEQHQHVPLVMMTHTALEDNVLNALEEIDRLPEVEGRSKMIRVIDE